MATVLSAPLTSIDTVALQRSPVVEAFFSTFNHPLKREVLALRELILVADPAITEGISWKVPGFRTSEYFATFHLSTPDSVQVILHLGSQGAPSDTNRLPINDPFNLLWWVAPDRAFFRFRSLEQVMARRYAFTDIILQWISYIK